MITGRGPGAPSVTPDTVFTLGGAAYAGRCKAAIDLSAIRRSDTIVGLLAARRLPRSRSLRDPAVELLGALAADVDQPDPGGAEACCPNTGPAAAGAVGTARRETARWATARLATARWATARLATARWATARQATARQEAARQATASAGDWLHAAAAAAVAATVATAAAATWLVITGMMDRRARLPGPGHRGR